MESKVSARDRRAPNDKYYSQMIELRTCMPHLWTVIQEGVEAVMVSI